MAIRSYSGYFLSTGCFYGCIPGGISEGCKNCTAATNGYFQFKRKTRPITLEQRTILEDVFVEGKIKGKVEWSGHHRFLPHKLEKCLSQKRANCFLFTSMGEPALMTRDEFKVAFEIIARHPRHRVIFVTKLPIEMRKKTEDLTYPSNVSIAVSVEDDKYAYRIDALLKFPIPRENKEVWAKPLLGRVSHDLNGIGYLEISEERAGKNRKRRTESSWIDDLLVAAKQNNVTVREEREN